MIGLRIEAKNNRFLGRGILPLKMRSPDFTPYCEYFLTDYENGSQNEIMKGIEDI